MADGRGAIRGRAAVAGAALLAAVVTAALILLPPAAVAGLLTACSATFAVLTARAALRGRAAGPRWRALLLAGGTGLAALAGAASGVAALVAPETLVGGVPLPAEIPLVGLFLVAALHLPAVLRPPQRRDAPARLRFRLDVLGVTAALLFTTWLLLFSDGLRRGASITALTFGAGATALLAVTGMHALRHRAALQWCGPAAALSMVGQTALVVGLDFPGEPNATIAAVAAAAAINVAAGLLHHGAVRVRPDEGALPPPGSEPPASFPLHTLLLLGSALVTAHHLLTGRGLDAVSILLGGITITTSAAREWVSALALRRQAGHLADQGNRLRGLMFGSAEVAMILDANLAVRWQSPAAARQFGLSDQEVLGRAVPALVHPDQAEAAHAYLTARLGEGRHPAGHLAVRLRDGFGRWRETEWTADGPDPAEPGNTLVVHVRDVTRVHDLEQALRQATHLDPQTGLANRAGLLRAAGLIPDAGAMIVVELGGLTAVGDVHGRELAEAVLVEAARRLRGQIGAADVPARLGETRLAVLTRAGAVRAHLLAGQLVNALSAPYPAAGTVAHLSAWAGLADVTAPDAVPGADPGVDSDTDEVIRRASLALRSVRSAAPGTVDWYDAEMETRLLRRSTLEQDLPAAVAGGGIDLSFQPIVELDGHRPAGVEVLPSWRHPTLGPVAAGELLPLAEELGLAGRIEHDVLYRSCRLLAGWRRLHGELWLAVGVRPHALTGPAFQAALHIALEHHQLPPSALVLVVAERHLLDGPGDQHGPAADEVAAELGRLRARGVRTAVDDFGTGPAALSRLRILPIDLVKATELLDVAVTVGRRLGLEVIAHGLAQPADLDAALAAGCRLGQGDLLGRPMPAEHLEALLAGIRAS